MGGGLKALHYIQIEGETKKKDKEDGFKPLHSLQTIFEEFFDELSAAAKEFKSKLAQTRSGL